MYWSVNDLHFNPCFHCLRVDLPVDMDCNTSGAVFVKAIHTHGNSDQGNLYFNPWVEYLVHDYPLIVHVLASTSNCVNRYDISNPCFCNLEPSRYGRTIVILVSFIIIISR